MEGIDGGHALQTREQIEQLVEWHLIFFNYLDFSIDI